MFQEVRRLDRKVQKMGKALKKLGLIEDTDGEFVDSRTTQPQQQAFHNHHYNDDHHNHH